jgi:hypothetical protein
MLRAKTVGNWLVAVVAAEVIGFAVVPSAKAISSMYLSEESGYSAKLGISSGTSRSSSSTSPTSTSSVSRSSSLSSSSSRRGRHHHQSGRTPAPNPNPGPAVSGPTLFLSDGVHTLTLTSSATGISYTGTLGKFSLSISSGVATGDALLPTLNISNLSYGGRGNGNLTIRFSNTSIGALAGSILGQVSGQTSGGNVSYSAFGDASNKLFGNGTLLGSSGPLSGAAFSGKASAKFAVPGPFSVTEQFIIAQYRRGSTSFSATFTDPADAVGFVSVPDVASTIALFGLSLTAIGLIRRKLSGS